MRTLLKNNFRAIPLAIMSLAFSLTAPVNAALIDFEPGTDLTPIGSLNGLTFSNRFWYRQYQPNPLAGQYHYGIVSGNYASFGAYGDPAYISSSSTFTIGSGYFTNSGQIEITGYSDEAHTTVKYTTKIFNLSSSVPKKIVLNWTDIKSIEFVSPYFVLDDLIINELVFTGPTSFDTQASLQQSARKLRSIFNASAISSNFANMNTYDCNLFDAKGMCISAGGRYTTVDNPDSNTTSAVVVVGYKATPNIRIGGFLDQNVNNNTPSGINISNKNPLMGAFVVWNQNQDGLGYQVKLANAYQDKNVDTTREVIGTSEAGKGSTDLTTQSYVGELSYAFNYNDKTLLRPYLALRHTTIKQDAYTESGVTTPLSYASLKDRSTTALLGLKLNHQLTPKTILTASLGIEQDLEHSVDDYSATSTGISGLTSENFNDSIKRIRPVASAGAYYAVSKTQQIAGDVYYQQLHFQSTGSTTAYFNYTVGF